MNRTAVAIIIVTSLALSAGCASSPAEQNKEKTRRFFAEAMNQGNYGIIEEMFTSDYTLQGKPFPPAETKMWAEKLRTTYPKMNFKLDGIIAEGNQVAVWWVLDLGEVVNGSQLYSGINLLTFADDGKCKTNWEGLMPTDVIPRL